MNILTTRHTTMNIKYSEDDLQAFVRVIDILSDLVGALEMENGDVIKLENNEVFYDDIRSAYETLGTLADIAGEVEIVS